jgi:CRISP-associated protein Cas1
MRVAACGSKRIRLIEISDVALFGNVSITTPALSALLEREIPVTFHSHGGWFRGIAHGVGHRNVEVRTAQYRMSFDEASCLRFARELVAAKIANQRTILRRNWRGEPDARQSVLDHLAAARKSVDSVSSISALLGIEGDAAATYFRAFAGLIKSPGGKQDQSGGLAPFRFEARNRRPPADPVNAMLSLAYAMLTRHLTIALASVGFDPLSEGVSVRAVFGAGAIECALRQREAAEVRHGGRMAGRSRHATGWGGPSRAFRRDSRAGHRRRARR